MQPQRNAVILLHYILSVAADTRNILRHDLHTVLSSQRIGEAVLKEAAPWPSQICVHYSIRDRERNKLSNTMAKS